MAAPPTSATTSGNSLSPACSKPPNPAFWEQYRRGGNRLAQINFLGLLAILLNGNVPEPSNSATEEPQVKDGVAEEPDLTLGL
jgi:hypothetical protein